MGVFPPRLFILLAGSAQSSFYFSNMHYCCSQALRGRMESEESTLKQKEKEVKMTQESDQEVQALKLKAKQDKEELDKVRKKNRQLEEVS